MTNNIAAAKAEWEAATSPYPLLHRQSYGEEVEELFRRYGDAIAWLDWGDCCLISKIETLKAGTGAATALLSFLKSLADKHSFRIYGNPVVYEPTSPQAATNPLSQEALNAWYSKRGFVVGLSRQGVPYLWYPDMPAE